MSEMLTVPTAFENIPDLSAGLIDRVDSDQIILYGPTAYEPGTTVDFSVLLADETPGLTGRGVVIQSVDGGEERDPSTRFDIFISNLELGEDAAEIFEGMVLERQLLAGDEAGEADAESHEVAFEDAQVGEEVAEVAEEVAEEAVEEASELQASGADAEGEVAEAAEIDEVAEDVSIEADAGLDEPPVDEVSERTEWDADSETVAGEMDDVLESSAESSEDFGEVEEDLAPDDAGYDESTSLEDELDDAAALLEAHEAKPTLTLPTEIPPPDDAFRGASPPEAPSNPGGFEVTNELSEGLVRPVEQDVWTPTAAERPEPRPSTGLFNYPNGLPIPSAPPRPDIDPSLIVTRAPHPSDREGDAPFEAEVLQAQDVEEVDPHEVETFEVEPQGSALESELEGDFDAEAEVDEIEAIDLDGPGEESGDGEASADGSHSEGDPESVEEGLIEPPEYESSESAAAFDEAVEYGEVESRD